MLSLKLNGNPCLLGNCLAGGHAAYSQPWRGCIPLANHRFLHDQIRPEGLTGRKNNPLKPAAGISFFGGDQIHLCAGFYQKGIPSFTVRFSTGQFCAVFLYSGYCGAGNSRARTPEGDNPCHPRMFRRFPAACAENCPADKNSNKKKEH